MGRGPFQHALSDADPVGPGKRCDGVEQPGDRRRSLLGADAEIAEALRCGIGTSPGEQASMQSGKDPHPYATAAVNRLTSRDEEQLRIRDTSAPEDWRALRSGHDGRPRTQGDDINATRWSKCAWLTKMKSASSTLVADRPTGGSPGSRSK